MNKILSSVLVVALLLAVGSNVFAAGPIEGCTLRHRITTPNNSYNKGDVIDSATTTGWGTVCLLDSIYNVTDWIFYGLLSLVSVFTIYGGFQIVTAGGNTEKVKEGRQLVIWATVGLIVAFLSKVIPSVAQGIIGA